MQKIHEPPNGPVFLNLDIEINGPPNRSVFENLDSGIHGPLNRSLFLKMESRNQWNAELIRIFIDGCKDPRTA